MWFIISAYESIGMVIALTKKINMGNNKETPPITNRALIVPPIVL